MNEIIDDRLHDILLLESIEKARSSTEFSHYSYNGKNVPRVTKILNDSINKDFLLYWAAKLGTAGYLREKDFATDVGSRAHEMIENFLKTGNDLPLNTFRQSKILNAALIAYNNFKDWFNNLLSSGNRFELIATEVELSCPYYGGTLDCLCKINDAIYIIDFKTSKSISYEYILQVCAYKWIVDHGYLDKKYGINHIDGLGIIRVDKFARTSNDLFLNEFDPIGNKIIKDYTECFGSMLYMFYSKLNAEYILTDYSKYYKSNGLNNTLNCNYI